MPLEPGTRLRPYEIITLIGEGGMGEVWLATELRLGRKVALKLLPPDLTRDPTRIQRFEQEARAASALNHQASARSTRLIIGRTAVRQLGGTERFLSRWSTDLFMDCDWSSDRGLVGTYMVSQSEVTPLAVWPMANPEADKPDRVLISKPDTGFWQAQVSPRPVAELCRHQEWPPQYPRNERRTGRRLAARALAANRR